MRIIFSSRPAFGHVFAIAPLAHAARAAGHDVIFASGSNFLPRLQRWGFETREVGDAIEWGFQQAAGLYPELLQPEHPEFGARMFVDVLGPRSLTDMSAVIEEVRPDLVVYEGTDVGAAVAAAASGIPAVCHSLTVWVDPFFDAIRGRMHVLWDAAGVRDPALDVAVGDALLDIWPPSMQSDGVVAAEDKRWPLRPITWGDPDEEVPASIGKKRGSLVFVSLGTMFWGKELLGTVLEALERVDCDALVLAGVDATPDELSTQNPRVRVAGFVNQAEVLRYADVVVHHGGAGTMLGALSRGLPALVIGEGGDRRYTAASLRDSGAGITLDPRSATADAIAEALGTLLSDPRYRERATAIRQEIEGMPSPEDVVDRLPSLARAT